MSELPEARKLQNLPQPETEEELTPEEAEGAPGGEQGAQTPALRRGTWVLDTSFSP